MGGGVRLLINKAHISLIIGMINEVWKENVKLLKKHFSRLLTKDDFRRAVKVTLLDYEVIMEEAGKRDQLEYDVNDDDDSVKDVPPKKKSIMQRLIWHHHIPFYQRHSG